MPLHKSITACIASVGFKTFECILFLLTFIFTLCKSLIKYIPFVVRYKNIDKDIILITGGGRGLGRSLAYHFARYKPKKIIIWDLNNRDMIETCNIVKQKYDIDIDYNICDITDYKLVKKQLSELRATCGSVSILVNNAGVLKARGKEIVSGADCTRESLEVNTLAQINLIRQAIPSMMTRSKGHIVQISSIASKSPIPFAASYNCSKFAITGYMQSLTPELMNTGVVTTTAYPGYLDTAMFSGCKSRVEWLVPRSCTSDVANDIVAATLCNKREIFSPFRLKIFYLVSLFMPEDCYELMMEATGMNDVMSLHGYADRDA